MFIAIENYNPEWPSHFSKIQNELSTYLENVPFLSIEHVGSTSVPGLPARPIIDITIVVSRLDTQTTIDSLESNNFTYLGELGCIDCHKMHDPNQSPPRNVYVGVDGAVQTRNHLGVRDTLRSHPTLCDEYAKVKLELATREIDAVSYIDAKSEIYQKILAVSGILSKEERANIHAASRKSERIGAIKTGRCVLREFVIGDVPAFYELESREEVVRYQTWPPRTMEQAQREVVTCIRNSFQVPRKRFELAVTYKGVFVGRVGAMYDGGFIEKDDATYASNEQENKTEKPLHVNLWFSFLPKSQGKGLATEAMKTFVPLLGSSLRLEIECDPRNIGSWKLAERLGFEKISLEKKAFECKGEWVDSLIYQKTI